jgi:putative phosphoesterase
MIANQKTNGHLIGVISDTHNLLRPEAMTSLENVDLIIHAGDVCNSGILEELQMIAPVVVVRGNNDKGAWANDIPIYKAVEIEEVFIYVIHDIKEMCLYPAPNEINVVISGHSHQPFIREENNILYLNPGSAGPRRFNLPVTIAKLNVNKKDVKSELVQLLV